MNYDVVWVGGKIGSFVFSENKVNDGDKYQGGFQIKKGRNAGKVPADPVEGI